MSTVKSTGNLSVSSLAINASVFTDAISSINETNSLKKESIMSIIDQANHNVQSYESGKSKPFTGQRMSVHTWKTVKDKESVLFGIKRDSKFVSLPLIKEDEVKATLPLIMPHVLDMLHKAQDKIIKEKLESDNNVVSISNDLISMSAIIEYLGDSNESGRLTKESIATWFGETIEAPLAVSLAEKLGASETPSKEQSDKIMAIVGEFKSKLSGLAGGKTNYSPKVASQLQKALAFAPENDSLAVRFNERLNKMINVTESDLLDAL